MVSNAVYYAMEAGHWSKAKQLIMTSSWSPQDLERKHGVWKDTLLIQAAQLGKVDVIELLLDAGADIEGTSKVGFTALYMAALKGLLPTVLFLLDKGAAIESKTNSPHGGHTPLIAAVLTCCYEVATLLIERGANINAQTDDGWTALYRAAQEGHLPFVKFLLDKGVAVETKQKPYNGATPLILAALYGYYEVVALLVEGGANINALTTEAIETETAGGMTPLIAAAHYGCPEIAALLVEKGVNINAQDDDGSTALYIAAREGHLSFVQLLLDKGADIEAQKNDRSAPLLIAASNGRHEVVALLIDRGANINARAFYGRSALYVSVRQGHVEVVKLLCEKGADLSTKDMFGYDALRILARKQNAEEINAIIHGEAEWRRVKNLVTFLQAGGLSSADWSVRGRGGGGLMPTADGTTAALLDIPSSRFALGVRRSKVLENRDLCRIVVSYIPKPL